MTHLHSIPVSIGIPTYNRADGYLRQALQSAMAQDYEPLEIIVADNGSTDNTEDYVRSLGDARIRYIRQPGNIDANDNFNYCLQQAEGTYFLLLHDDDLIDPGFLSACMAAADGRTDIGIIRTGTRLIDRNGAVLSEDPNSTGGLSLPALFEAWLTGRTALYFCSTMFNTRGLKAIGGLHSPHNLFQDVVAEFRLAAAAGHADVTSILASYRRHGANRGDAVKVMAWCEDCRYLLDLMCSLAPEDKAKIRALGRPFFSRKCYRKAGIINNPFERWFTYLRIYRYFNYAQSPGYAFKRFDYAFLKQSIKALNISDDWMAMRRITSLSTFFNKKIVPDRRAKSNCCNLDHDVTLPSQHALECAKRIRGIDRPPAVFIHGLMRRSGTNFIGELLRNHPEFIAYPHKIYEVPFLATADHLLEAQRQFFEGYKRNRDYIAANDFLPLFGASFMNYLHAYAPDKKRLLLKVPGVRCLDQFFNIFPDELLLILIRDGRDLVHSTIKTWPNSNFVNVCKTWNESALDILRFIDFNQDKTERFILVKFEEAVRGPEQIIEKILRRFNIDMTQYPFDKIEKIPVKGSSALKQEGKMTWKPMDRPKGFNPIGRWSEWDAKKKRIFKRICGQTLKDIGYCTDLNW